MKSVATTGLELFEWGVAQNRELRAPHPHAPGHKPAEGLPPEFHAIADVLRHHQGASHSINAYDIAIAANVWPQASRESRRCKVREIIRSHMMDFKFLVLGCTTGYYTADSPDEIAHYERSICSRIREMSIRLRDVRRKASEQGFTRIERGHWT